MIALPTVRTAVRPAIASAFTPSYGGGAAPQTPEQLVASLFANGEQGFWHSYDDFSRLSQDAAGTLPYTALEQPVGRVLDRSGRGNHASQVTSTARGVVSARVNLLASTQSFVGGPFWGGGPGIVVTPADIPSPLGGMADKIEMTAAGSDWRQLLQTVSTVVGASYSGKFLVKAAAPEDIGKVIAFRHAKASAYLLTTLTADWAWAGRDEVCINSSTQFTITHRPSVGTTSGVISFHLAAAELKLASQSTLPYQRVTTPTDYDAVGFPKFLRLDGTDDYYTCGGGGSTTGFYYSDVLNKTASGISCPFSNRGYGAKGYELTLATNKATLIAGNGTYTSLVSADSFTQGVPFHLAVWDDLINLNIQINGGAVTSTPRPAVLAGQATITLHRTFEAAAYFNGQITEPIYRAGTPPNAYERGVIRAYQMQKAGML